MGAVRYQPPRHSVTGDALGYHGDVVMQSLRCVSCMHTQVEPLDGCAPMRESVAGVTCSGCGVLGRMRAVRS